MSRPDRGPRDRTETAPTERPLGHAFRSRTRMVIFTGFLALAAVATVQRGVLTRTHATFPIFRQSFVHLRAGTDLYAMYPEEQGARDDDRFKYTPSAALLFAPFAFTPFVVGLLLWTALNAVVLFLAVDRLFPGRDGSAALLIVAPALVAAIQSTSSNALVAALMVGAFVALERRQDVRASLAIATGALMKLFPAAAIPFMLAHPRPRRILGTFVLVVAVLLAAPLLVTSPGELIAQYRSWLAILFSDERDLTFARSIMVVFRNWSGSGAPNWVFQVIATGILVTPLAVRRSAWTDPKFRRGFLASLLIYVVVFNHQAENASYIIAAVGLAIWFLAAEKTWIRVLLLLMCLGGLEAIPYTLVWFWLQFDLLDGGRLAGWIASKVSRESAVASGGAEA